MIKRKNEQVAACPFDPVLSFYPLPAFYRYPRNIPFFRTIFDAFNFLIKSDQFYEK